MFSIYITAGRKKSGSQNYIFYLIFFQSMSGPGYGTAQKKLSNTYFSDSEIYMKIKNFSQYVHLVLQEGCWLLTSLLIGLKS